MSTLSYEIPRDRVCYYCERDNHARCALSRTCACYTCHGYQGAK